MTSKLSWLLLPSLLFPTADAGSRTVADDRPLVTRLDDIRARLIEQAPDAADHDVAAGRQKLAQYWPNWRNWANWMNYR